MERTEVRGQEDRPGREGRQEGVGDGGGMGRTEVRGLKDRKG